MVDALYAAEMHDSLIMFFKLLYGEGDGLVKINIFYVFSAIGALLFIGYLWIVFLPMFSGSDAYPAIRTMVILLSATMGLVVFLTLLMAKLPH